MGGYSSQTYVDETRKDICDQDRPAVLIYAGDFDPFGEDIDRDFLERTDAFDEVMRVALTAEQVELDALPPDLLRGLYETAVDTYWDAAIYDAVVEREAEEARLLGASA